MNTKGKVSTILILGLLVSLFGGYVAYIIRPVAQFRGQLDFPTVITRGSHLTQLDRATVTPVAEQSFYMLIVGMLAGATVGMAFGVILVNTAHKG